MHRWRFQLLLLFLYKKKFSGVVVEPTQYPEGSTVLTLVSEREKNLKDYRNACVNFWKCCPFKNKTTVFLLFNRNHKKFEFSICFLL